MRRADRLFQLVQILRRGRVTTAARIAAEIEVSERTVYRDIADLMANGIPIEGEAGVGYVLPAAFDLPPLMFDRFEIEALVVGARLVTTWTDSELARAARSALGKVEQVLPEPLKARLGTTRVFAPDAAVSKDAHAALPAIRAALEEQRVLAFEYESATRELTQRRVRPLGLFFWGKVWTLAAWCELREDFRSFRIDRMQHARSLEERFTDAPGRTLEDFLARVVAESAREDELGPAKRERALREPASSKRATPVSTRERARRALPMDASAISAARRSSSTTKRPAPAKPPKLDLDDDERAALRSAGITLIELADLGADALHHRVHGAIPPARCAEIAALADFQRLGSIGLEMARDFVQLGFRRVGDLVGEQPVELYERLQRLTRSKQDPCVEDALRCAIAQAEEPSLPSELRDWWHWTSVRGQPSTARPQRASASSPRRRR